MQNKAELIFMKWKAELAEMDRSKPAVEGNFELLFDEFFNSKVKMDTAMPYLEKAIKAHYPSDFMVKVTFKKVKKFIGTDISKVAIDMSKKRFEKCDNVELKRTTNLLSIKEPIDMIYSVTVFQHLPKDFTKKYIQDAYKILKDGGALFFNVLSGIQDHNIADICFEENGVCEPSIGFNRVEIGRICKDAGFNSIEIIRMEVYVPTDKYWWYWVICKKG